MILNPLRNLGGKLNHFHLPEGRFLRTVQLANSIRGHAQPDSHFNQASVEDIQALKSNTAVLDHRAFHKFQFELMVHSQSAVLDLPSTILDELSPYQRKISQAVYNYASKLSARQLLYVNLALKGKLFNQFPNWSTLHLSVESPSRVELEVVPSLLGAARVNELRALRKKGVMKEAVQAKGK